MKVIWTRPAARDLEAIQDYIARDNPVAAYRLAQTVRQRANHLADHPIKTGIYLAFYNVLKIPMARSSKGQTKRSRKAVSQ